MDNRKRKKNTLSRLNPAADPATFFKPPHEPEAFAAALEKYLNDAASPEKRSSGQHPLPLRQRLDAYPPPQDELDCHGLTSLDTEKRLHRFLERARHHGLRTVRIITGKGLHSARGPVLQHVVETELRLLKRQQRIVAFRWEKKEKQRSGALIVFL